MRFIPLLSLPFYHCDCPKIEHQCLTFYFNLDLDHSAQGCNTSELDFILLSKHCRRVAHLCKHGPCSVGLDASSLCVGREGWCLDVWTVTAWSFCFLTLGQDHCQPIANVQTMTHQTVTSVVDMMTIFINYYLFTFDEICIKGISIMPEDKSGKSKWSPNK